jgi:APA family basic amino acid/polyamine antiporter
MGLWSRKSVVALQREAAEEGEGGLRRTLSATNLTLLGIGAIIGAGIFVLTGNAAAVYAGPAVVISMILAGIACGFAGLCYAEFASMIPIAGSAYTYGYATMGEFVAWIIGWDLMLEYLFGAATVAVGWGGNFVPFLKEFGIIFPAAYSNAPFAVDAQNHFSSTGAVINLPAMALVALMTVVLVIGIRESHPHDVTITREAPNYSL